jgi:hypothetical protein
MLQDQVLRLECALQFDCKFRRSIIGKVSFAKLVFLSGLRSQPFFLRRVVIIDESLELELH